MKFGRNLRQRPRSRSKSSTADDVALPNDFARKRAWKREAAPRATASGPIATTSSPSLATAFNTPAPFASHSLQAASQRIARIASVSVSAASWRASWRSGSLSLTMSSDRPMTTFPFATHTLTLILRPSNVSKLDAARPAVRRGCRQRVDERLGGEERSRVFHADAQRSCATGLEAGHGSTSGRVTPPRLRRTAANKRSASSRSSVGR